MTTNKIADALRKHLDLALKCYGADAKGDIASWPESVCLKRGRLYRSESLDGPSLQTLLDAVGATKLKPKAKECFMNSLMIARNSGGKIQYCEGYTLSPFGLPNHHAWVLVNGKAVDITPQEFDPKHSAKAIIARVSANVGGEYFGIAFSSDEAWRRMLVGDRIYPALRDYEPKHT